MGGEGSANRGDPNACTIVFRNDAGEEVNTIWINESDGEVELGTIAPGRQFKLDSFKSHKFKLRRKGGTHESKLVSCRKKHGYWVLAKDYSIDWSTGDAKASEL